ncbi:MAG: hypothetical protein LBI57_03415 [Helicobacteraceae bacterium]|jgi:hypothetical protein|nr:hypothetical protein [Helicobacteraceae bacterium]
MPPLIARLKAYAESALLDASIANESDYIAARAQAEDLASGRAITDTSKLDIAIYRLKARLKVEVSEEELTLYQLALAAIKNAPLISDDTKGGRFNYVAAPAKRDK